MLTNIQCQKAEARDKKYKLSDAKGLYLEVRPSGGKFWRMKYRYEKKEKLLSFGEYPTITLKEAREKCEDARKANTRVAEG